MRLDPGTVVGGYEIVDLVGAGGMGAVYRARQPSLRRDVAIKVLASMGDVSPEAALRFRREIAIHAGLSHPNLVRVLDGGDDEGRRYLVLELVEGAALDHVIRESAPMPEKSVLAAAASLLDALDYLHQQGIIHRDIKPGNILVDESGATKLADFGLARGDNDTVLTRASQILGTPRYLAPEVVAGGDATAKGDVYALGIIFYEMLTGHWPYEGQGFVECLEAIATQEPVSPGRRGLRVSPGMDSFVMELLDKDPGKRRDAAEALSRLGTVSGTSGMRVHSQPEGRTRLESREPAAPGSLAKTRLTSGKVLTPGMGTISQGAAPSISRGPRVLALIIGLLGIIAAGFRGFVYVRSDKDDLVLLQVEKSTSSPKPSPASVSDPINVKDETPARDPPPFRPVLRASPTPSKALAATLSLEEPEMIKIPAGSFVMGSDDGPGNEKPQRRVSLDAYWIDKYEVTNRQYGRFMRATGHKAPEYWDDSRYNQLDHPVVGVTWHDAMAYARWARKRLPTEAEWEKAARGEDGRKYPWGSQEPTGRRANFADRQARRMGLSWGEESVDDGHAFTAPAGSFPAGASPYGVMDMAGNVWEWCADVYDSDFYKRAPDRNPSHGVDHGSSHESASRVVRGGSWGRGAYLVRCAGRSYFDPPRSSGRLGFRCARAAR